VKGCKIQAYSIGAEGSVRIVLKIQPRGSVNIKAGGLL
jgi:hypothetical protein